MKLILVFFLCFSLYAEKPDLFLLKNYTEDKNVSSWYMSEKLDGVRAYWDGERLVSRSGKFFSTPKFFTEDFPQHELDGELWIKRDTFSKVVSIVNKKKAHQGWSEIKYMIFELPNAKGNLLQRLNQVKETKYIQVIEQIKVKDKKYLQKFLKAIELKAGEGLVVRDGSLKYFTGRNNNALKVKSYIDAECEVVGYNEGKGRSEERRVGKEC